MDFFGAQRYRIRRSLLLYGLFFVVVLLHALAVALFIAFFVYVNDDGQRHFWRNSFYIWGLLSVIGLFLLGSFWEWQRLRDGGRAVARRVGAVRLFIDNSTEQWQHSQGVGFEKKPVEKVRFTGRNIAVRHERDFPPVYRRFYEFAEQMAIASGIRLPFLYVMLDEQGINAFVAGRHADDMALVVTQGALDKLSDEALYGLIGHEYGHILHGDAKFNLHLMVVLGGLQLWYDATDSTSESVRYNRYDYMVEHRPHYAQNMIERDARKLEKQTEFFTNKEQWVTFWKKQNNPFALPKPEEDYQRNIRKAELTQFSKSVGWLSSMTPFAHILGFSGMLSAQLIKHSFNREREYLADATSVQLNRSPAILETLKAIYQDPVGSRLLNTPEINGLSHFFFASSGDDLSEDSWFSIQPSIKERMQAIDHHEYDRFAEQILKEKQIKMSMLQDIYKQRRSGTWNELKSPNTRPEQPIEFTPTPDVVVDGRLQTTDFQEEILAISGTLELINPQLAKADSCLPEGLVALVMINQVGLPQIFINHYHDSVGVIALIESVMLCHQLDSLDLNAEFDLATIWCGYKTDLFPHSLNQKLLQTVANTDRRLDNALLSVAIDKLKKLAPTLKNDYIQQIKENSLSNPSLQNNKTLKKYQQNQTTLQRYQTGLQTLIQQNYQIDTTITNQPAPKKQPLINLWRAIHLYKLLVTLTNIFSNQKEFQQLLIPKYNQLKQNVLQLPNTLANDIIGLMVICAYSMQAHQQIQTNTNVNNNLYNPYNDPDNNQPHNNHLNNNIQTFWRYLRLLDLETTILDQQINDKKLAHLLTTIATLNSIDFVVILSQMSIDQNNQNHYKNWLSTLHTIMLNDTILNQEEFDCLNLLAEIWLGEQQLIG